MSICNFSLYSLIKKKCDEHFYVVVQSAFIGYSKLGTLGWLVQWAAL